MSKFLLLLGPSGVGKSSVIEELIKLDNRFTYISPYTTRPLRKGEYNKIAISEVEMDERWQRGELLAINELYGIRYATPRPLIDRTLAKGSFPLLDWPVKQMDVLMRAFPDQLYAVYITPPSVGVLKNRLIKDGRDRDGHRLRDAVEELKMYSEGRYAHLYDLEIVSEEGMVEEIAQTIYENYLRSLSTVKLCGS